MQRRLPRRAFFCAWSAISVACGGHSETGRSRATHDASVSTGGKSADASGGGVATGGMTGSAGTGGAGSSCDPSSCPAITCPAGEIGVIIPGGCCRTACVPRSVLSDAGSSNGSGGAPPVLIDAGTCEDSPLPDCSTNGWPHCAPDWQTAESWYLTCPDPQIGAYLATCGGMHAIVVPDPYVSRRYFYDNAGRLAGFEAVTGATARCEAYFGGFSAPSEPCKPMGAPCYDAGSPATPTLSGLDAGAFLDETRGVPDCKTGQAAYDAYFASQLSQYNRCADDTACTNFGPPGLFDPSNRCEQPCNVFLTGAAINSQILSRLNQFGNFACALCDSGPLPSCSRPNPLAKGTCVSGKCVFPQN